MLFIPRAWWASGGYGFQLIIAGLVAAAVALAIIFVFINVSRVSFRCGRCSSITSAFLFVMALKPIGQALQEFQEQLLISFTPIKNNGWMEAIGLNSDVGGCVGAARGAGARSRHLSGSVAPPVGKNSTGLEQNFCAAKNGRRRFRRPFFYF